MNKRKSASDVCWLEWQSILAALVVSASVAIAAQKSGQPAVQSGERVTLAGDLQTAFAYGAPNYGENPETDQKETYIVLTHFSPIDVRDTDGAVVPSVSRAQLIVPIEQDTLKRKVKQLVGAGAVIITGKVFPATTGHHHEPIVLIVESVEKSSR